MQLGIAGSTTAQLPELVSTREGGSQIMTFGEAVIFALQRYEKARGAVHFIGDPYDLHRRGVNLITTGPNARLLSKEMATFFTGRYLLIEILPFSFAEYLNFYKPEIPEKE